MVVLFVHTCWVYCQDKLSLLLMSPNSHLDYSARSEVEFDKAQQVYDLCTLCDFICILFWVSRHFVLSFSINDVFFSNRQYAYSGNNSYMILTYSFSAQALRKQGIYHNQKAFVGAQNKHIDVQQFIFRRIVFPVLPSSGKEAWHFNIWKKIVIWKVLNLIFCHGPFRRKYGWFHKACQISS